MQRLPLILMEYLYFLASHIKYTDVAFALLGLFIFSSINQKITNKGPMLWPVMGIIPTVFFHFNHTYEWVTEALIKSGGTFYYRGMWMGNAYGIITVDPSKLQYMLKTRFTNFPKGKYYRDRFFDLLGDGIFNADGDTWKEQRRVATLEMHSNRFVEYSFQTIQDLVHIKLLKLIEKLVISNESIDLQDILLRFTFDNVCTAAFGVDPGCLSIDLPDVPFAKAFEQATELTLFRFTVPPFIWKAMKLFCFGSEKELEKAVGIVHEFAEKTVCNRRTECYKLGSLSDRSDLLSRLTEVKATDDANGVRKYKFSKRFLRDFCISFILAGRDTSSVALAWFFWLLSKNPQVESRILHEIDEVLSHRKLKYEDMDVIFTIDELNQMEYLQAALSESLRLYPSVPLDLKEVREDDIFPDGTMVKKGARVLYSIYSMGRIDEIWGKDCREYKPERWIKDGKFVSENQFKYAVFNAGPRLCVGKKFAYLQMKMVAASVLLRYSVDVVKGQDVAPKLTTTLYMKNGLVVHFKPRK
ncbi:hypothetical protein MKW94_021021 [Papaver nudicaule]|uniref:Cytochrome P450 n=1 Tax=Papaver nudicaule TaxID=74823 RepID=A0AA42AX61_PAPNU|nr:hypothetical protein [Papaver nudicaule]MCL7043692.1 hypothetical protein [Papaver nudicaule]